MPPRDEINLKGLALFFLVILALVGADWLGVAAMTRRLEAGAVREDRRAAAAAPVAPGGRPYFPHPREQPDPVLDLEALRAREADELDTYGWVDRTGGVVRVPIVRAMDLLLERQGVRP